ncbi:hypothetical protein QTP88_005698 [Uroleucon formosanum]
MDKLIENAATCELRSVIRFLNAKNIKPVDIHGQICEVRLFNEGRTNVHDEERTGRPSLISDVLVQEVEKKFMKTRFTMTSLAKHFPQISRSLLHEIVSIKLNFRKLCARWVPKILTDEHRVKRQGSALQFLSRYEEEGDKFLSRIVTGNETWVSHVTPESKQQSMEQVLLVDFLPRGQTINANSYCETLKKLRSAIKNNRRGMLSRGIVFIHDNARPRTANVTKQLLTDFAWEQFNHPPYSPDLAPSDFHFFLHMKSFMGGQNFNEDDEVKKAISAWLQSQASSFYDEGIQKLVPRYDKCLNNGGNYVEK